jgi:hypothetical protein
MPMAVLNLTMRLLNNSIKDKVFQLRRKFPLAKFTYVDDASMSDGCALHE